MNPTHLLDTKTININDFFGNGKKYVVPTFQRDYAWQKDNWEDLWNDILAVNGNEEVHYLGAIVLQNKDNKVFSIIDGQQRITTITLIALACICKITELAEHNIDREANLERVQILSSKFIGEKDPSSLTYFSKLNLNENNNSLFQTYLLRLKTPKTEILRNLKDSDRLLWEAYTFFYEKINEYFALNQKGEAIAKFLTETIAEKLMFIQIVVESELRAYTVFETLNSRGLDLTVTDLLKNYLFSLASEVDLPHIQKQWNRIIDTVGLDRFPIFLRHYWISKNNLVRQEYLYKSIRQKVLNIEDLFNLLEDLETKAVVYIALQDATDELWQGNKAIKKLIRELELFQVKQCLPILLVSYEKMPDDFEKILQAIVVISFRMSVIGGYHSGKIEEVYNKASLKVANGEIQTIQQLTEAIKTLYKSDTDFRNDFSTFRLNFRKNKKLIRYILFEIENQLSGNLYDFEENTATIEHILPENYSEEWLRYFPKSTITDYTERLGNFTLLEKDKNRNIGNQVFAEKQKVFAASTFSITKKIDYPEWNADILDKRQAEMAKIATTIWRVPYYYNTENM